MQKVGGSLSKHDIVNEVFNTVGEVAKKSDFISAGLKEQDVYTLFKQGYIERIRHGYLEGYTKNYTPVHIYSDDNTLCGIIQKVKITKADKDFCVGELV